MLLLALSTPVVCLSCTLLVDTSGLELANDAPEAGLDGGRGDAPGQDAPTSEGGTDAGAEGGCPAGRGPAMINVGKFCIDSTEVTQSQYAAFLAAKAGDTSGQPTQCQWNTSFAVNPGCRFPFDPTAHPKLPVGGEDWCDAYAFCQWAGKRLCGRIGGGPTATSATSPAFKDATQSEWFAACSRNGDGLHAYPYGTTYQKTACNGENRATGHSEDVGSFSACEGGFPGLFDMSGNLGEWENGCEPGDAGAPSDGCAVRGSAFWGTPDDLRCDSFTVERRDYTDSDCDLGIRCCADLQ